MRVPSGGLVVMAGGLVALLMTTSVAMEERKGVAVEPGDLMKRADLVGKEVVVDDRVSRFQTHQETGFDQIFVKSAPDFPFDLPARLRRPSPPSAQGVKIKGTLRRQGDRWWVDVAEFDLLPGDLDRLNRGVGLLSRMDLENRTGWVRWAETRGRKFHDKELLARARAIEGEVVRAASDKPGVRDKARYWMSLAESARVHEVAEPEPSAQAHRGFRAALADARSVEELEGLSKRIERFFPAAARVTGETGEQARWDKAYAAAPADGYRGAPAGVRSVLDHWLWADVAQRRLERKGGDDPRGMLGLAEEAARLLPDRPAVAGKFLEKGAETAAGTVGSMRLAEVESLAKLYRETLKEPEKAKGLFRSWLDEQKNKKLSARDAEGRINLAQQYETLLDDHATAVSLLRDAWRIDPESREVVDAFRRRGFRKVDGEWVEARSKQKEGDFGGKETGGQEAKVVISEVAVGRTDSLRNATAEVVVTRMGGKPNRKTVSATQGQVLEQWIYLDARLTRYVNFVRHPGEMHPRVVSYYSLPRRATDAMPGP